ncbi:hypothetical protein DFA_01988 [Cavenderia fasciculata]|uniref:Uncharacterized protein n=1 Tax=Cavenderia fasciculata TaxID=261658 RepID=F4PR41_CACFS|nr:uncharacterized protein DFA_01988 [Cavenderia fasciculata]EGG22098.1 hypothetical protein DFA_01988 [Cavenderia fasciculata]|eukprot:XP_004359949.1 hypothetical protein DFA_01988 [Cavenderia fasciculata]
MDDNDESSSQHLLCLFPSESSNKKIDVSQMDNTKQPFGSIKDDDKSQVADINKKSTPKRSRQRNDDDDDDEQQDDETISSYYQQQQQQQDDDQDDLKKRNKNDNKSKSSFQTCAGKPIRISNDKLSKAFEMISGGNTINNNNKQDEQEEKEIEKIQQMYNDVLNYLTLPFHKEQPSSPKDK